MRQLDSTTVDPRVHELFMNEVEGKIIPPQSIHELFMDDGLNAQMDQVRGERDQIPSRSLLGHFCQRLVT